MRPAEGQCQRGPCPRRGVLGSRGRGGKSPRAHWLTLPGPDLASPPGLDRSLWQDWSGFMGLLQHGWTQKSSLMPNPESSMEWWTEESLDKSEGEKL